MGHNYQLKERVINMCIWPGQELSDIHCSGRPDCSFHPERALYTANCVFMLY